LPEIPLAPEVLTTSVEAVAVRQRRLVIAGRAQKASATAAARSVSDAVGGRRNRKQAHVVPPSEALRRESGMGCTQRVAEKSQHDQRVAGGRERGP